MKSYVIPVLLIGFLLVTGWFCHAQSLGGLLGGILRPPMNISIGQADGVMPPNFRGEATEEGVFHVLEDDKVPASEHSPLYLGSTSGLGAQGDGKTFAGPPTINWTIKKEGEDGNDLVLSSANTNVAKHDPMLPDPGIYKVENDGSRPTSDSGSSSTTPGGSQDGQNGDVELLPNGVAGSGQQTTTGPQSASGQGTTTDGTPSGQGSQVLTSSNLVTLKAHDITSPNLFVLFQESGGAINSAGSEAALSEEFEKQLTELGGKVGPDSPLKGELRESSLLAVVESPKDAPPNQKTSTVFRQGALFDEAGRKICDDSKSVTMEVDNKLLETRKTVVGATAVSGIFVRRNIPFLAISKVTDNDEKGSKSIPYTIIDKNTGKEVEKFEGSYLFRIANYPREQYTGQPDYEFAVSGIDKVGNSTLIRVPLYVVNTQSSFEGGKAE